MTREELQARIDAAKEVFDRQEAAERAHARNGAQSKSDGVSKKSSRKVTA